MLYTHIQSLLMGNGELLLHTSDKMEKCPGLTFMKVEIQRGTLEGLKWGQALQSHNLKQYKWQMDKSSFQCDNDSKEPEKEAVFPQGEDRWPKVKYTN